MGFGIRNSAVSAVEGSAKQTRRNAYIYILLNLYSNIMENLKILNFFWIVIFPLKLTKIATFRWFFDDRSSYLAGHEGTRAGNHLQMHFTYNVKSKCNDI